MKRTRKKENDMARLRDVNWDDAIIAEPVKNGFYDERYGGTYILELTDENIKDLVKGKILSTIVEGAYTVLIRLKGE